MARKKLIKYTRVGPGRGVYRFRREWVDEYLQGKEVEPAKTKSKPSKSRKSAPLLKDASCGDLSTEEAAKKFLDAI